MAILNQHGVRYLISKIFSALQDVKKSFPDPMVEITYSELRELRDSSNLKPGRQYRIVDYMTTTSQKNTQSAGHQFDIIVTADNENTLNEVARACRSEFDIEKYKEAFSYSWDEKMLYVGTQEYEGKEYYLYESEPRDLQMLVDFNAVIMSNFDTSVAYPYIYYPSYTRWNDEGQWGEWYNGVDEGEVIGFKHNPTEASYFKDSNLAAWQIWYSLDNDINRFDWGKIVELSPVSKRKMIRAEDKDGDYIDIYVRYPEGDENGKYAWARDFNTEFKTIKQYIRDGEEHIGDHIIYTTSENPIVGDWDINDEYNIIDISSNTNGMGVIYRMIDEFGNDCPYDFKNIKFYKDNIYVYTFTNIDMGDDSLNGSSYNNIIKKYILDNIVYLNKNILGHESFNNTFGNDCRNITFGNYNTHNTLGDNCTSFTFGDYCIHNTFGNNCDYNSFGNSCSYNSLGNNCRDNSFGNSCSYNSLGNNCRDNSFGNDSDSNIFCESCSSNSFGESSSNPKSYYRNIIFDSGNSYINLNCTSTTSSSNYFQNVRIGLGVNNTGIYKTIIDSNVGQTYQTVYKPANSKDLTA